MSDLPDVRQMRAVIEQALYEAEVDGLLRSAGRIEIAERIAKALTDLPDAAAEPPPFGTVPFGTMFIPGAAFLHGDNEWHEYPGSLTFPPRPSLDRVERGVVDSLRHHPDDDLPSPPSWDQVDWLIAIIDRLTTPEVSP